MNAVFAVQVRTGYEIKAKEMLCHVLKEKNDQLVKSVYALETQTEVINESSGEYNTTTPTDKEIKEYLEKKEKRALITNKRRQLEAIKNYSMEMYEELKRDYLDEINELEKEIKNTGSKKKIKSVLSGYILVELKLNAERLPDHLWHLIKSVPLVQSILSRVPIPEHEVDAFAKRLDEILEPEVEFSLENDITEERIEEIRNELIIEFRKKRRKKKHSETLRIRVIEKYDEMKKGVIYKVREFLHLKKNKNSLINKIKIRENKNQLKVNMPLHVFKALYPNFEIRFIRGRVQAKDFLDRLLNLSDEKGVLA